MRVISITGGKGGVGKSTISVNLAISLAKIKKKVLLFDADLGLANIDVMLGLSPQRTIHDFLSGKCTLDEVCITGPYGIKILPAASGVQRMAELSSLESGELIRSFSSLSSDFDFMLVDTAAGISNQVIDFTHASQDIMVVICNDPASLTDSYAVIKILHQKYLRSRFGIVVNKARSMQEAFDVFSKFQSAAGKFINVTMNYLGYVPQDDCIFLASRERKAVIDRFPSASSAIAFNQIGHGLLHWQDDKTITGGMQFFLERIINRNGAIEGNLCKV